MVQYRGIRGASDRPIWRCPPQQPHWPRHKIVRYGLHENHPAERIADAGVPRAGHQHFQHPELFFDRNGGELADVWPRHSSGSEAAIHHDGAISLLSVGGRAQHPRGAGNPRAYVGERYEMRVSPWKSGPQCRVSRKKPGALAPATVYGNGKGTTFSRAASEAESERLQPLR